jgi:putative ABC transport system substrate-binding protein
MRRRRFITSLVSVVAARAQQTVTPVIGLLSIGSPDVYTSYLAAFRRGLNETGYVEGQNVAIEYRWGNGDFNRMPALTTDLVNRQVDVIAAGASARKPRRRPQRYLSSVLATATLSNTAS